jgi:hypothetical protein
MDQMTHQMAMKEMRENDSLTLWGSKCCKKISRRKMGRFGSAEILI